jgi:hypothetical protein
LRYRRAVIVVFALFSASLGLACSLLLDTSANQCNQTSDCVARGGSFATLQCVNNVCVSTDASTTDAADTGVVDAGPWGCLGSVVFPQPDASTVDVILPLVDLQTTQPVTTVDARACAKIDVNCTSPIITTVPDAMGLVHLSNLPAGFDGFVLLTPMLPDGGAPDAGADAAPPDVYVPSLVFFNPPIVRNLVYTTTVMVKTSALAQIAAAEQTTLDPTLSAVFMETVDCNGNAAAGVSVTIDSTTMTTQGFYFQGGLPALNAPATDMTGYAGFVNVSPTTHTVTGTLQATGQRIGTATVLTAKSMISYTTLAPSP